MALFSWKGGSKTKTGRGTDPGWVRGASGKFRRMISLDPADPALKLGCVYVVWNQGVKPQWVYVGLTDNLGVDLAALEENQEISAYEDMGGLYMTWAPVKREFRPGVLKFLADQMKPAVANPMIAKLGNVKPVPVKLPGQR